MYGKAIILATRYEAMRKRLVKNQFEHSMFVQESVYQQLPDQMRENFDCLELGSKYIVRDDQSATRLYYRLVAAASANYSAGSSEVS